LARLVSKNYQLAKALTRTREKSRAIRTTDLESFTISSIAITNHCELPA
jgi:hypothetical protein